MTPAFNYSKYERILIASKQSYMHVQICLLNMYLIAK